MDEYKEAFNSISSSPQLKPTTILDLKSTLIEIAKIFIPTFASYFFTFFIETINMSFVGHLGDPYLISGVALGTLYFYTFGLTVVQGFNSVVSTLVS